MPSSSHSSGSGGRRATGALLAIAFAVSAAHFIWIQWRWNEAPRAAAALEFLARGADYEAARFEDGIGSPGWVFPIVKEWAARLPPGATVAAEGPWELERAARYYFYPRRVFMHQHQGPGPGAEFAFRPGAPLPPARAMGRGEAPAAFAIRATPLVFARIVIALLTVAIVGHAITRRAFAGAAAVTRAGLASVSFLLGTAAVALWSLLLTWLRIPHGPLPDAALVLAAVGLALQRPAPGPRPAFAPASRGLAAVLPLALIVLQIAVGTLYALHGAPESGDDLSEWMLKAKHYYAVRAIALPPPPDEWAFGFHDYPPLVPALLAFVYRAAGGVADGPAKLAFACFFAATLGALHDGLRAAGLSRARALALVAILAVSGNELVNHAGYAWADLALAAFGVAAAGALARGARAGDARALALGGILLGGGALVKLEGAPVAIVLAAAATLSAPPGDRRRAALAVALPFAVLAGAWALHCALRGFHPASEHVAAFEPGRLSAVIGPYLASFVSAYRFAGAFAIPLAGLAIGAVRRFPAGALVPALGFLAGLVLPLGAYVVTAYAGAALEAHVGYTAPRLLLHVLPMGFLAAGWAMEAGRPAGAGKAGP